MADTRCPLCRDPHGARYQSTRHTWQPGCDLFDGLAARVADYLATQGISRKSMGPRDT